MRDSVWACFGDMAARIIDPGRERSFYIVHRKDVVSVALRREGGYFFVCCRKRTN